MSTSPNLPAGAFITTLGGRRCTALPRTDINTQPQTSTTSTFSTSLIPTTTPAAQVAPQVAPAPAVVENTPSVQTTPAPLPLAATTSASTIPPPVVAPSSISEPPLSAAAAVPQPQSSVADTTTTALAPTLSSTSLSTASVAVVTPTTTPAAAQVTPSPAQSEVLGTDTTSSNGGPFTIIGLGSTTIATPAATETPVVATAGNSGSRSNGNGSTVAVAGGVIGGVALVSLIAFFIWFWRRQVAKKRRDTLLTPLSADSSFGAAMRNEKRPYLIHRDSIGPTARSTKVKAALRAQVGRVRGRFDTLGRSSSMRSNGSHSTSRSVDMNRGNSQFLDDTPILGHERNNSTASARDDSDASLKERIMEMWKRFIGSDKQNLDDDKNDIFAARGITGSMRERARTAPSSRPLTNKPDFLTLLNMDDGELDREAQRRRMSRTRGGSEGSGVGGLSLNIGANPFSDANAISSNRPTLPRTGPPVASGAIDPFTDAHAIDLPPPKPSTYIDGIRRSRGQSIDINKYDLRGLHVVNEDSRPPSGVSSVSGVRGGNKQDSTFFRDSQVSAASFESFATKRDKFRSDPFDLEQLSSQVSGSIPGYTARPGFNSSSNFSTDAMRFSSSGSISMRYQQNGGDSRRPPFDAGLAQPVMAHTRTFSSSSSSKYASGITSNTLDEWSEPGPDVGPAVRYDASRRSSAAEAYNPYSDGNSSRSSSSSSSSRTGVNGKSKMGYAL